MDSFEDILLPAGDDSSSVDHGLVLGVIGDILVAYSDINMVVATIEPDFDIGVLRPIVKLKLHFK